MRRRLMLKMKISGNTLTNPDDFIIFSGGVNFYSKNFHIETDASRDRTRQGIYSLTFTAKPCTYHGIISAIGYPGYPIEVPQNCTKIKSVSCDVSGLQIIIFGAIWDGTDWTDSAPVLNTGWILDPNNINLNGSTHFMIMWRVDDSNHNFTVENTPTSVTVEFE